MPSIKIDSVKLKDSDRIARRSNKDIVISFDKVFDNANNNLNLFVILKSGYNKNADHFCQYINVFCKYYDEDAEYLTGMLDIKYQIDNKDMAYGFNTFMNDILSYILSDTMVEKILKLVEDQYSINLSTDEKLKEDAQALQFENDHGKAIMAISVACKLTVPLLCHYYAKRGQEMAIAAHARGERELTEKEYFNKVYLYYFPLFQGETDLYNKLVVTANMHINRAIQSEDKMWKRARNKNITPNIQCTRVMNACMIDLLPKYAFSGNMVTMNHIAMPSNINNALIAKDKYEYFDLSITSDGEELSGLEKLEANNAKVSDLDIILSKINIKDTVKKLKKRHDVVITDKEVDYYKKNIKNIYFSELILQFFADDFGGYYDLQSINKRNYICLIIIFKKIMKDIGFRYVHQLLTGNISSKIKRRRVSSKQLDKIACSERYKRVMKSYSMTMTEDDAHNPLKNIAILINTPIELVDWEMKDNTGSDIIIDADVVSDEYLRFIDMM
jgi:hypothetical protein